MRMLSEESVIAFVIADPEPQIAVWPLDRESAMAQCDPCRPNLMPKPVSYLLELQRRMLRIRLQEGELLFGAKASRNGKRMIRFPKIRRGAVLRRH